MLRFPNFMCSSNPCGVFRLRTTLLKVRSFHKIPFEGVKNYDFPCSFHVLTQFRKFHGKLTSFEIRNLKKSLLASHVTTESKLKIDTSIQKNHLNEFISNRTSATDEDWDTLFQNITSLAGNLNVSNINGKVMESCAHFRNLPLAKNFLGYLKKKGVKFNSAVLIEFLRTCYFCQDSLTAEDYKTIRIFTNYLIRNFETMDAKLGSCVIRGLILLNDWAKCLEIVEDLEKNYSLNGVQVYSPVIVCLLKNKQFELARKIMSENLGKNNVLCQSVYIIWIEIFQDNPNRLEELLTIFKDYNVVPKKIVCDHLIRAYSQLASEDKLIGKFTTVESNGKCNSCMKTLEKNILHENEFNELRDVFLNRVLVDDDVFKNTTPQELQSFYKVVKIHAPFDIVIDGLNVMYSDGRNKSVRYRASLLMDVVNHFFNRNKKIFMIGREHMKKFPSSVMEDILEKCTIFLINNESEDDPFLIYSALYSGPKCCFVTRDYFRSEKFRLNDDRLYDLFKRWQLSHQIIRNPSNKKLETPLRFKFCVQKWTPQCWHIPYHNDDYTGYDLYEKNELTKWLCLKK